MEPNKWNDLQVERALLSAATTQNQQLQKKLDELRQQACSTCNAGMRVDTLSLPARPFIRLACHKTAQSLLY